MSRHPISSAVPADVAEKLSDRSYLDRLAEKETALLEEANEMICSPEWWAETLEGMNAITAELPAALARCMENLDRACRGDSIARDAITAALHIIQRRARRDAYEEAEERIDG